MKNDPKIITARFNSKCQETGREIKKGESILYYPIGKAVYHLDTKQHQEYKEWLFDIEVLNSFY